MAEGLLAGLVFLSVLPSTVQSCVVFTAIARGNVAGAVMGATASNLAGIALTPLLVALLLGSSQLVVGPEPISRIVLLLLVPFLLGLLVGRFVRGVLERYRRLLTLMDRGVIVAVVYSAFSRGVRQGVWQQVSPGQVALVIAAAALLLSITSAAAWWVPALWRASRPDRVATLFCGSTKSLATGLPMATVLFPPQLIGLVIVPIIIYHPLQIVVCSLLAGRMAGEER
ncbi:bile acid:sodium symporter [Kineococcus sp. SYSU DK006]|uniref:bile acid:sodium symporter n=1 Tax=Kineococcus sp. SYSU DK006 TaxID=3383127 RepID=UPI003D7C8A81